MLQSMSTNAEAAVGIDRIGGPAPPASKAGGRRITLDRRFFLVFGLAATIRLVLLTQLWSEPAWHIPVIDERTYINAAATTARGDHAQLLPYWQPPGIIYSLSAFLLVFGGGTWGFRSCQVLLGAASAAASYLLAARVVPRSWAVAVGVAVALNGVHAFSSLEILPAVWAEAFLVFGLELLARSGRHARWSTLLGGAVVLGSTVLFSPLLGAFLPLCAYWLWCRQICRAKVIGFAVAVLAPAIVATTINYQATGRFVAVSTNGPANFFLGNNSSYPETVAIRPGPMWNRVMVEEPAQADAAQGGRPSMAKEEDHSRYFVSRAVSYIGSEPGHWLISFARKMYLCFNGREIPRNVDIYDIRDESNLLRVLVGPRSISYPGLVLWPMCLIGLALHFGGRIFRQRPGSSSTERCLPYGALFFTQALAMSVFFVTSRYRAPLIGVATIWAIYGVWQLSMWCGRAPRRIVSALVGVVALFTAFALDTPETRLSLSAERYFQRGQARVASGNHRDAAGWFARAYGLEPGQRHYALAYAAVARQLAEEAKAPSACGQSCSGTPDLRQSSW